MSKHAESIEIARREYIAAIGTSQEMAKRTALIRAIDAAKGRR